MSKFTIRIAYCAAAVMALAGAGFAFQIGRTEAKLAGLATRDDHQNFEILRAGALTRGYSLRSDRSILYACDDSLSGRLGVLLSEGVLNEVAFNCARYAQDIHQASPTWAFPPYVLSAAAFQAGDNDTFVKELTRSKKRSLYASWLAERRVALALRAVEKDETLERILSTDFENLMQSTLGRAYLARVFVQHPVRREQLTELTDDLGAKEKSEFLDRVRDELARARFGN